MSPTILPNGNHIVFAYGNLIQGLPAGYKHAILLDFERCHKGYASCIEKPNTDDLLYGRLVEVSPDALGRFDFRSEALGDYHRFLADVQIIGGPTIRGVWVYQLTEHATPNTKATSANGALREEPVLLKAA